MFASQFPASGQFQVALPVADQKDVRRLLGWLVGWIGWIGLVGLNLKLLLVSFKLRTMGKKNPSCFSNRRHPTSYHGITEIFKRSARLASTSFRYAARLLYLQCEKKWHCSAAQPLTDFSNSAKLLFQKGSKPFRSLKPRETGQCLHG